MTLGTALKELEAQGGWLLQDVYDNKLWKPEELLTTLSEEALALAAHYDQEKGELYVDEISYHGKPRYWLVRET